MQQVANYEEKTLATTFSGVVTSQAYQKVCKGAFSKEQAQTFVADVLGIVSSNYALKKCDAESILSSGLVAQRLNLPLTQSLGFAYIVPYGSKAQFLIG